jgi:hypothetical protein
MKTGLDYWIEITTRFWPRFAEDCLIAAQLDWPVEYSSRIDGMLDFTRHSHD